MERTVHFSEHAQNKLRTLDDEDVRRITDGVARAAADPSGAALKRYADRTDTYLLRVGTWRVVVALDAGRATVLTVFQQDAA